MIRQHPRRSNTRSGLTRVDLIAILAISLLVVMLFFPAAKSARINNRGWQCLHNIRNVALATQNFASSNDGKLPPLSTLQTVTNSSGKQGEYIASWATLLLPALDSSTLLKQIRNNAIVESGRARIGDEKQAALDVFGCPIDPETFKKPGRISYVVNAGFISQQLYHGDPDRKHIPGSLAWIGEPGSATAVGAHSATGVIWHQSSGFESSLEYVSLGDGTSYTLLLAENLQAGNWYDTDTARIGFGFPVSNANGQVPLGTGQVFESAEKPLNAEFPGGTLTTTKSPEWQVNANRKAKVGSLPRPSSNHERGVNVMMCDGSGKFLNQNIHPYVYLKLLTSNGAVYGEGELKLSDNQSWWPP